MMIPDSGLLFWATLQMFYINVNNFLLLGRTVVM